MSEEQRIKDETGIKNIIQKLNQQSKIDYGVLKEIQIVDRSQPMYFNVITTIGSFIVHYKTVFNFTDSEYNNNQELDTIVSTFIKK